MKRLPTLLFLLFAAAGILLALSFFAPLPLPAYQDFSVMYFTNLGRLNGIPIYDYPAQLDFVKTLTPAGFTFHPYPYPPWFSLATLFLGLLPIQVAARFWFLTNLVLIGGSAWLLTSRWKPIPRLLAVFAAIMFIPAFGLLVVGQYSAPVLLGAALFIWSARKQASGWAAVALLLLTFKPHIGGILFLAGAGWLVFARTPFARRALISFILGGLFLAVIGFAADPAWPLTYLQSLGRYREIPGVQTCGQCASLSVALVRVATGQSNIGLAAWVSLVLAGVGLLLFWRFRARLTDAAVLMAFSATLTLLVDPYLLNYDYILLLIPLFWLVRRDKYSWLVYFIPWVVLALGRDGNPWLALAGVVTFVLILRQPIDAPPGQAYNPFTIK